MASVAAITAALNFSASSTDECFGALSGGASAAGGSRLTANPVLLRPVFSHLPRDLRQTDCIRQAAPFAHSSQCLPVNSC